MLIEKSQCEQLYAQWYRCEVPITRHYLHLQMIEMAKNTFEDLLFLVKSAMLPEAHNKAFDNCLRFCDTFKHFRRLGKRATSTSQRMRIIEGLEKTAESEAEHAFLARYRELTFDPEERIVFSAHYVTIEDLERGSVSYKL